jgi:hypothetical protein
MLDLNIEELQQTEADCIRKFRNKAEELRAVNPTLSPQIAFARAVEAMPKCAAKYQHCRLRLGMAGVGPLPLR